VARENSRTKLIARSKSKSKPGNETLNRSSPTTQKKSEIKSHSNKNKDWPQPSSGTESNLRAKRNQASDKIRKLIEEQIRWANRNPIAASQNPKGGTGGTPGPTAGTKTEEWPGREIDARAGNAKSDRSGNELTTARLSTENRNMSEPQTLMRERQTQPVSRTRVGDFRPMKKLKTCGGNKDRENEILTEDEIGAEPWANRLDLRGQRPKMKVEICAPPKPEQQHEQESD
jgi:hypothetical protein